MWVTKMTLRTLGPSPQLEIDNKRYFAKWKVKKVKTEYEV